MIVKDNLPFDVGLFSGEFLEKVRAISSLYEYKIQKVSHSYANKFVLNHHYLRRKIYIARNVSYGLYIGDWCVGVAMFGYPVWVEYPELCPPLKVEECPELIRLCTISGLLRNTESYFLSRTMKLMRKDWEEEVGVVPKCITSFCDLAIGFNGSIYRATNFKLLRETMGRATNPGKAHGKWSENNHEQKSKKLFFVYYF